MIVSAAGAAVNGELMTCSIALLAAAIASLRNCMLVMALKFVVPRFSAVTSMSVISTSMIKPMTRTAPR